MSALLGPVTVTRPTAPAELTRYLYEKYGERVYTFCYSRLRNREEAQDAVQTTFVYVMRSLQRGVEPEFELAWLLKIAFNACRSLRRSTGKVAAMTQDVEDMDELASASPDYEHGARLDALRDALSHLPESQRRAILLREWQGLSYAEIADDLGLTVGAVETLIFRARRNLTSRLGHIRAGAFNLVAGFPFFRSIVRGGIGKLGLVGAGATVALMPVVVAEVTPAHADRPPALTAVSLAPAKAPAAVSHPTSQSRPALRKRTAASPHLYRARTRLQESAALAPTNGDAPAPARGPTPAPADAASPTTGPAPSLGAPTAPTLPPPAPAVTNATQAVTNVTGALPSVEGALAPVTDTLAPITAKAIR